jgi:glycosyltransferase involved in cell wall biosynthesis
MTFFELDTLVAGEIQQLNSLDHLFVPSKWAADIVNKYCKVAVSVAPLGVDTEIFYPGYTGTKPKDICRFLNVGKLEVRKGHDVISNIFTSTFPESSPVELWLMVENPFLSEIEYRKWSRYLCSKDKRIRMIPRRNEQEELALYMNSVDFGFFPSRAEGWNLDMLEMMACGKPCITTRYSAHTEFCNDDNSFLADIDGLEPATDGKWFFGTGNWAKLNEQNLSNCLRKAYDMWLTTHYEYETMCYNATDTGQLFSWKKTAEKILEIAS